MVFCRKKKEKEKYNYHYLVENQREGKKVKQEFLKNFGKDKNSCEELARVINEIKNKEKSPTTKKI